MMTTKQFHTFGPVAQLVSAPPCHGGGRRFKSGQGRGGPPETVGIFGSVAQLVERTTENREVTGSTPVGATTETPGHSGVLSFPWPSARAAAASARTPRHSRHSASVLECACDRRRRSPHPRHPE